MYKFILTIGFVIFIIFPFDLFSDQSAGEACISSYFRQMPKAHEECLKAAQDGDLESRKILGDMFYWGYGDKITKDYDQAMEWYLMAAKRGHTEAKFNLGVLYEQGRGIAADYSRSFKWFMSAAQDGHPAAQFNVANMYSKGAGTSQNHTQASKWYSRAANQGDVESQYNMGNRYALGNGVSENIVEAYKWYLVATANGDKHAKRNGDELKKSMSEEQIQQAIALADSWRPKIEAGRR